MYAQYIHAIDADCMSEDEDTDAAVCMSEDEDTDAADCMSEDEDTDAAVCMSEDEDEAPMIQSKYLTCYSAH